MSRFIRRHSMERLELYDLDKLGSISLTDSHRPPPLQAPRKTDYRRSSMNPSVERYQFLCNMTRNRTDPIYAATPMFTTIPNSKPETSHRQLLGVYIREENVKQLYSSTLQSPEIQPIKGQQNEHKEAEDKKQDNNEQASDETDDEQFSSSSSSSGSSSEDDKNLEDEKGIVEKILNRDRTN